jgi:hypothetical protein
VVAVGHALRVLMDPSFDRPAAPLANFPGALVRRVQSSGGVAVESIRDGAQVHMRRPGEEWRSGPYVLAFEMLVDLMGMDGTDAEQAAEAHLLLRVLNAGTIRLDSETPGDHDS